MSQSFSSLFSFHKVIVFDLYSIATEYLLMVSWNYYKPTVSLLHKNNQVLAQNIACEVRINFTQEVYLHALNFTCYFTIPLSNLGDHSSVYPWAPPEHLGN